jgi:hypothetical protein
MSFGQRHARRTCHQRKPHSARLLIAPRCRFRSEGAKAPGRVVVWPTRPTSLPSMLSARCAPGYGSLEAMSPVKLTTQNYRTRPFLKEFVRHTHETIGASATISRSVSLNARRRAPGDNPSSPFRFTPRRERAGLASPASRQLRAGKGPSRLRDGGRDGDEDVDLLAEIGDQKYCEHAVGSGESRKPFG